MFRFMFRNEQKEMLGRTIAELQEIKAELSVLTESIKLIVPGERENQEISEVRAEECRDTEDCTEAFRSDGDSIEKSEETAEYCPESTVAQDIVQSVGVDEDQAAPAESSETAERPKDDPAEAVQCMAGQEIKLSREWAVVNIFDIKRPWWKIWKSKNHLIRRSI
ncbi:MAG: hypothetical protein ACOY46_07550 [Bacillota bacterium]